MCRQWPPGLLRDIHSRCYINASGMRKFFLGVSAAACSWGRDLLLTPSVPGQMSPNLPYPLGHRLGEGQWLQVTQPEPNRVQTPVSSPQHQLAVRERQTAAHGQGRLTVGGGPETPGETVVCPRDIRARLCGQVQGLCSHGPGSPGFPCLLLWTSCVTLGRLLTLSEPVSGLCQEERYHEVICWPCLMHGGCAVPVCWGWKSVCDGEVGVRQLWGRNVSCPLAMGPFPARASVSL